MISLQSCVEQEMDSGMVPSWDLAMRWLCPYSFGLARKFRLILLYTTLESWLTQIPFVLRLKSRWASIIKATRQHATALGSFVFIYKTTLYLLKHLPSIFSNTRRVNTTSKHDIQTHARGVDAFIAGLVAGYIVFGRATPTAGLNSINQQMVLYVFSRVVLAIAKLSLDQVLAYSSPSAPK